MRAGEYLVDSVSSDGRLRNQNLCLTHCLSHCLLHHHRHCQPRTLSRRRLAATNGLRAHKFPPQHSRPAVVVVVEPCAQQRAHAQAHMRARSPTTHHHLLAAGEAGFTWGQPLVKCPNPHARGRGVVHNRGHRNLRGDRGASPAREGAVCARASTRARGVPNSTRGVRAAANALSIVKNELENRGDELPPFFSSGTTHHTDRHETQLQKLR